MSFEVIILLEGIEVECLEDRVRLQLKTDELVVEQGWLGPEEF